MKKTIALAIVLGFASSTLVPAMAQTSVGVSVGINQPGVYGRIDIGSFPQPRIVYPQPILVAPAPIAVHQQPIYLYVPPGHQKHWSKHCGRYNACGQPVYFVREDWVRERYEEQHHHHGRGHGHGNKHRD